MNVNVGHFRGPGRPKILPFEEAHNILGNEKYPELFEFNM